MNETKFLAHRVASSKDQISNKLFDTSIELVQYFVLRFRKHRSSAIFHAQLVKTGLAASN